MTHFRTALAGLISFSAVIALGQVGNTAPKITLSPAKAPASRGSTSEVTLNVVFGEGLHAYQNPPSDSFQIPVSVKVISGDVKIVKASYPTGQDLLMQGETKPAKVYAGAIKIPLTLKFGKKGGAYELALEYQQCTDNNCYPPSSVKVKGVAPAKAKKG